MSAASPDEATGRPLTPDVLEADAALAEQRTSRQTNERIESTTVGTGSYVAVSCTAMMLILTLILVGLLLLFRWLS